MNVQKISKFIPVIAAFLFLFGFARGALAITLTGEYNATTNEICIPTQGEDYWYPFQGWGLFNMLVSTYNLIHNRILAVI